MSSCFMRQICRVERQILRSMVGKTLKKLWLLALSLYEARLADSQNTDKKKYLVFLVPATSLILSG